MTEVKLGRVRSNSGWVTSEASPHNSPRPLEGTLNFDARRNMNEESTTQEFMIAINGPNLAHADAVIKEAMNSYWRSKGSTWHFFRTTVLEQLKEHAGGSQVLNRLLKQPSKLPFMEK